jgi:uncharacterized secreted protein with C-terminal beta-propeller domain
MLHIRFAVINHTYIEIRILKPWLPFTTQTHAFVFGSRYICLFLRCVSNSYVICEKKNMDMGCLETRRMKLKHFFIYCNVLFE